MYVRIHKFLLVLVLMVISFPYFSIAFQISGTSFYIPNIVIYCKNEKECRHEVGHLMDHDLNDQSKSKKFGDAIWEYLYIQDKIGGSNYIRDTIISAPGVFYYSDLFSSPIGMERFSSPQQELYAQLYANVDGDTSKLTVILSGFYKEDKKYNEIYDYLVVHKIIFLQ